MKDESGYHRAPADGRPTTATEPAEQAGTGQDSPRERLTAQAAGDHVTYDATTERYTLPAEHATELADEPSPAWRARKAGTPFDSVFEVRPRRNRPDRVDDQEEKSCSATESCPATVEERAHGAE
jgi:hypothetical protein